MCMKDKIYVINIVTRVDYMLPPINHTEEIYRNMMDADFNIKANNWFRANREKILNLIIEDKNID